MSAPFLGIKWIAIYHLFPQAPKLRFLLKRFFFGYFQNILFILRLQFFGDPDISWQGHMAFSSLNILNIDQYGKLKAQYGHVRALRKRKCIFFLQWRPFTKNQIIFFLLISFFFLLSSIHPPPFTLLLIVMVQEAIQCNAPSCTVLH